MPGMISFEEIARGSWTPDFPDPAAWLRSGLAGTEPCPLRLPLHVAAERLLWTRDGVWQLASGGVRPVLRLEGGEQALVDVTAGDGDVLVLAQAGGRNLLSRVGRDGRVLWQRSGPRHSRAASEELGGLWERVFFDDGRIFLIAAGSAATVDAGDGRWLGRLDFTPASLAFGEAFTVGADGTWRRRSLRDGSETRVLPVEALRPSLHHLRTPLPGGGALFSSAPHFSWMDASGGLAARHSFSGLAAVEGGLLTASAGDGGLRLTRWDGSGASPGPELRPLSPRARILGVVDSTFLAHDQRSLLDTGRLLRFERSGRLLDEKELSGAQLHEVECCVDSQRPLAEPDGAVVLAAVDPRGWLLARMRLGR